MSTITIYHNPRCSKSRTTLALLRENGYDPDVIEYLIDPPDVKTIKGLLKKLGMQPVELIRQKEHRSLDLPPTNDPDELTTRMAAHPEIIQRPIVVKGNQARLGRPPQNLSELL